jgi:hypothetical protein
MARSCSPVLQRGLQEVVSWQGCSPQRMRRVALLRSHSRGMAPSQRDGCGVVLMRACCLLPPEQNYWWRVANRLMRDEVKK